MWSRGPCLIGLAAAAAACGGPVDPVAGDRTGAGGAPRDLTAIDEVLEAAVRRHDVLGVVALAVDRHGVIYRAARGTADDIHDMPIRTDAVVRVASMTKPITSVAAMQLVERGQLALDDAAVGYLPRLARAEVVETFDAATGAYTLRPPASPITVRHLLTHTAGFGYPFTTPTIRDFERRDADRAVEGPLLFDPGTAWRYGTSTAWVGRLVESVSGQDLDRYFREQIFDPLGMSDTGFNVPETSWPRTMTIARRQPDGSIQQEVRRDPEVVTSFGGGGGLWSTADDYGRFLRMWLNQGELDGTRILSAATIAEMATNQVGALSAGTIVSAQPEVSNDFRPTGDGRGRFGLGFVTNLDHEPGRRAAGSLAWGGIYNTYFWIDPASGIAGVWLTQILPFADPQVLDVFAEFERAIYALPRGDISPDTRTPAPR